MPAVGPPSLPATGVLNGATGLTTDGLLNEVVLGAIVTGIDIDTVPDNGGVQITATGTFDLDDRFSVTVTDGGSLSELCYSGVVGEEEWSTSATGLTLSFVVPPLPIGGPYNLVFTSELGFASPFVLPAALTVIHRAFATNLFSMRSAAADPRDVGPHSMEDSD